jgi:hypothetical protein
MSTVMSALNCRESCQEIFERVAALQIIEESLNRHARPTEDRNTVHCLGISDDRLRHVVILSQAGPVRRYNFSYTRNVKTAVSVPDDLFLQAEAAARRLRMSRSQLFATAISEFLERQQKNAITERLNEVYSRRPAKVNSALHRAQLKSVDKDSW